MPTQDTIINVTDYDSVQDAVDAAPSGSGVVYFPPGEHNVNSQININKKIILTGARGPDGATKIIASLPDDAESVFNVTSVEVQFHDLWILNMGSVGRCIFFSWDFNHRVENCHFENQPGNISDLVTFCGSYTYIRRCYFTNHEPEAYAVRCKHIGNQININTYIEDSFFHGDGKGVRVETVVERGEKRPEGITINRNTFQNTATEQITIQSALHVNISDNIIDQARYCSIYFDPAGYSIESVYISSNYISPAAASNNGVRTGIGIYAQEGATVNDLRIFGNRFGFCGYGVILEKDVGSASIVNNMFTPIAHAGVTLNQCGRVLVQGNHFAANDFCLAGSDDAESRYIITNNFGNGNTHLTINNRANWIVSDNFDLSIP